MVDSCFIRRRSRLFQQLPDNSVVILASGCLYPRNRDSDFPFRVDSDFWYLTGFDEPESILVMTKKGSVHQTLLFVRATNIQKEIWTGRRLGVSDAPSELAVDQAYDKDEFESVLPTLLKDQSNVWTLYGQKDLTQQIQLFLTHYGTGRNAEGYVRHWHDLGLLLHHQRLYKTSEEVDTMRQAAMISALGHTQMMRACNPGVYEYQLAATMVYESSMQGAIHQAYYPIVASGANACILHYNENNTQLRDGDLVLTDAGCELDYYASDITRTFPVNGRFLDWQKDLYDLVLLAQQQAIDNCVVGNSHHAVHQRAVEVLCDGLIDLGLLVESRDHIIEHKLYQRYFMHGTGHWLGLDVHDVGVYGTDAESTQLEPGMVITVEPGIYIAENDDRAPKEWRGTGIRIEDDIHITSGAPEVLSLAAPKNPREIESIVGRPSGRRYTLMLTRQCNIAIVGAGPVGMTLALVLSHIGYDITLIEKTPEDGAGNSTRDARTIVLNWASVQLLKSVGIDNQLQNAGQTIDSVTVRQAGSLLSSHFHADDHQPDFFGIAIPFHDLMNLLRGSLDDCSRVSWLRPFSAQQMTQDNNGLPVIDGGAQQIKAELVIVVDGSNSQMLSLLGIASEKHDYRQQASMARLTVSGSLSGKACEVFTKNQSFVLVPQQDNKATFIQIAPSILSSLKSNISIVFFLEWRQR